MFQFLYVLGPAAITYFTVRKCVKDEPANWYTALIELLAYAMVDAAVMILGLLSSGKVEIVILQNGVKHLQYGGTAVLLSIPVAVICGILISAVKKGIDMDIHVLPNERKNKKKDIKHETEEK